MRIISQGIRLSVSRALQTEISTTVAVSTPHKDRPRLTRSHAQVISEVAIALFLEAVPDRPPPTFTPSRADASEVKLIAA